MKPLEILLKELKDLYECEWANENSVNIAKRNMLKNLITRLESLSKDYNFLMENKK